VRTPTAIPSTSTSNQGIVSSLESRQLAGPIVPAESPWTSGEKKYCSRFAITISRPNVVRSGTSSPVRRLRSRSETWST
jgi:hypothetical protein